MTKHMLVSGLVAGLVVALLATLLQFAFLEQGILLAERYETGELTHFAGLETGAGHDHAATETAPETAATDAPATAHHHDHGTEEAEPFWQRQAKTLLSMIVTYGGYGLVLVAGLALAGHYDRAVTPAQGLLWGLAGFAAFSLAPAMGLEPALPGVEAADLASRQGWWALCAAATVVGLALIAYGTGVLPRVAGVILLALPHIIGAPHLAEFTGILPPELSARHAARSLGVGLIAWVTLGYVAQSLWSRPA